jgi:hypothetical protein
MITAGSRTGKSVLLDLESDNFKPWRETNRPHYAEYVDYDTGETYWKKLKRLPSGPRLYTANTIIRHNEDGSYKYIKYRGIVVPGGTVSSNDMAWIILAATAA